MLPCLKNDGLKSNEGLKFQLSIEKNQRSYASLSANIGDTT